MSAWFYILRLKSGALYVGATADLNQRYKDHCSGRHAEQHPLIPLLRSTITKNWRPFLMRVSEKRKSRGGRTRSEKPSLTVICKPYTNSQNDKSLDRPFLPTTKLSLLQSCHLGFLYVKKLKCM
jgi:hypothetical protein